MSSLRLLLYVALSAGLILLFVLGAHVAWQIPFGVMTRDVFAIAALHPFTSILSNLGILLWMATASICAFAALCCWHRHKHRAARFFGCSALLSGYLLVDDFFMMHEHLLPDLGVPEKGVYALLGGAVLIYLWHFRGIIVRHRPLAFAVALGLLATSVGLDSISDPYLYRYGDWHFIMENAPKWMGIATWCSYYVAAAYDYVAPAPSIPPMTPADGAPPVAFPHKPAEVDMA